MDTRAQGHNEGPLAAWLGPFEAHARDQGYADATRGLFRRYLRRLSRWLARRDLGLEDLDEKRMTAYVGGLKSSHVKRNARPACRALLGFLRSTGAIAPAAKDDRDGPLAALVDEFDARACEMGYARLTRDVFRRRIRDVSRWLARRNLGLAGLDDRQVAVHLRGLKSSSKRRQTRPAVRALLRFLREGGTIPPAINEDDRSEDARIVREFSSYLIRERGLAPSSIRSYSVEARRFLAWKGPLPLRDLGPTGITRFILRRAATVGPATMKHTANALRSFLRFLRSRGDIKADLAATIPTVANWSLAALPKFITAEEVTAILDTCNRQTAVGRRDYAVLLLLARLGLRACEVTEMMLDDVEWDVGEILVRGKGGREDRVPLPHDVGAALADYLRNGRPQCSSRRLFLRAKAPWRECMVGTIKYVVERAIERSGLDTPSRGSHLLRYTLATDLLKRGAPLSEVGELLRHRSTDTSMIYAKVDFAALRELARPWPGARA